MTDTTVQYVGDPEVPTSLPAVLRARVALTPDAPFLSFDGERRTFAEALAAAESSADALASLGVKRGDKVATFLPNCTEILDLWFGSALLGAVFVPINTGLKGEGLRYIVEHSEAEFIAVDAPLLETLDGALRDGTGPHRRFVRMDGENGANQQRNVIPPGWLHKRPPCQSGSQNYKDDAEAVCSIRPDAPYCNRVTTEEDEAEEW